MLSFFETRFKASRQAGVISCTFRQTNVVWVLYAYASSQLVDLRFRRDRPGGIPRAKFHDPPALEAGPGTCVSFKTESGRSFMIVSIPLGDVPRIILSAPAVLLDILPRFLPYSLVLGVFAAFTVWNGGIVLGMFI